MRRSAIALQPDCPLNVCIRPATPNALDESHSESGPEGGTAGLRCTEAGVSDGSTRSPEHERLIRKLESIAELTAEEKDAVRGLPLNVRDVPADQEIVAEG